MVCSIWRGHTNSWGNDGGCELEFFTDPTAHRQALRYAMRKYGHFREVQSEPHPT
jgi:hypothetical protein